MSRKYLPTIAELIDRLSIVQLKEVFITEHKEEYAKEIQDIVHDLNELLNWKKDIPNKELVKILFEFVSTYTNLYFQYIQAHTTNDDVHSIGNRHADLLATSPLH